MAFQIVISYDIYSHTKQQQSRNARAHYCSCTGCQFASELFSRSRVWSIQSLAGVAPVYLADDCRQLSDIGRRPLHSGSSDIRMLSVPVTHNRFGDRSFTAAGPRLWNELPADLRRPNLTFPVFKQKLKTYLFGLACS